MGRQPCCDKIGLKRGPWTIEEDHKLMNFIIDNGVQCWRTIPKLAGLLRCGKSCRLRWINYLRPDLKRGMLSELEENQIIQLHSRIGNRWSKIASHFPGRTDNEIKNHWNTRIKKRLKLLGIDPVTHKPVEPKEKTETESSIKTMPGSISTTMDANSKVDDSEGAIDNRKIEDIISADESVNVIINYKPVCENLDVDLWMNQETNTCTSYSSTFSLEESLSNSFMGESTSVQEDSIQDWDSMFSWDVFNQLEEEMFCFRNGQ